MQNRIREAAGGTTDASAAPSTLSTPIDRPSALISPEDSRGAVAAQIGPRAPGVVYYDGPRMVQVTEVITDESEAQRVLKRNAARFAILVRDLHAGTEDYIGAIWTGSDRVLKAVA
jgi:hypothetical protein